MTAGDPGARSVKVWDPFVRIAHWTLAGAIAAAWLTRHRGDWHEWLGYAALGIVLLRLVWGWTGTRFARFGQFVRSPAETLDYARASLAGAERRHVGHNPLGACMIVLLLATVLLVAATGWLYTTEAYWGVRWVEELHEGLSNALFSFVGLHIAGVAWSSLRRRENLVAAMLHGRKRAPEGEDVA
jgi:cytochrome b